MSFSSILPAVLLALGSLALIGFIGWALFHSLFADSLTWFHRRKLSRKEGVLTAADALIRNGSYAEALTLLKGAFLFDQRPGTIVLIESITHHHLSILSRLIAISERTSSHVPNLAIVEDLLSTRGHILRALHETKTARRSFQRRRKEKKDLPQWALAEYQNKTKDLGDKLEVNRKSLQTKLSEIFTALASAPLSQEVTYH